MTGVAAPERIARAVRADIRALTAYPVADAAGCIKLDAMECPYELPAEVRDDIARAARETPLNRYPAAANPALQAQVRQAFEVPAQAGLLFGNGSDELIHLIIQACCEPGDTVLSPWPSFVYFDMAARLSHARFVGVPLTAGLELDLPATLAAIEAHQPKVVFLALPNNPTGDLWPDAAVRAILDAAPGLVVLDEAYQPFAGHTWMPRIMDEPNAVVMRTVSKIGLAGLRFGYLAGHPAWIAEFDKVRPLQHGRAQPGGAGGSIAPQAGTRRAGRPPARRPPAAGRRPGRIARRHRVSERRQLRTCALLRQAGRQRRASCAENAQNTG